MNARWCRRLLSWVLPAPHRGAVLGHFDQEFEERQARDGARAAARWYAVQAAASLPGAARLRLQSWPLGQVGRDFLQDVRYAFRQLHRASGFAVAATLMLAIGLGLVAGAYTIVNGVLIKGWDVPDSRQMFRAMASTRGVPEGARVEDGFSRGAFEHFRQHAITADYAAYLPENFRIPTRQGELGHYVYALYVGDGFLDVLRLRLQRGPGFTDSAEPQVILAHRAWRRIFGEEDPETIGRAIQLSGIAATVVGILEPGFDAMGERPVEALVNLQHARGGNPRETATQVAHDDNACCVWLAGRRRPGYSREQVQAELAVLTEQYRSAIEKPALEVNLRTTAPGLPSDRGVILVLLGAGVSLVWCLTCANVGNLFLARSLRRDREIAVRLSLGATRGRLIRQLLTEGLVLAGIAAPLAFVMTYSVPFVMERLDGMPASMFAPDVRVALIVALGTVLTCLVVALAPALQTTRVAWRGSGVAIASSSRGARDVVLAVQIAVAMVLVISATLITRGILRAATTQADFALHETTAVNFALPAAAAEDRAVVSAFHDSLADVVRADSTLALAASAPVTVRAGLLQTSVQPAGAAARYSARLLMVSPSAFDILDVPIVEGRAHDDDPAILEAVINQSLARRLAPAGSAVGLDARLHFNDRMYRIVGVARDAHLLELGRVEPMVFVWPQALGRTVVLARTAPGLQDQMTRYANQAYAGTTVTLTPLTDAVRGTLRNAWIGAAAAGGLALVALVLAIVGVFGVFSYLIEARRRDIGIRMALGASRRQVRVAIAQQCRRAVLGGVAAGIALSLAAGQLLRGSLFGLSPLDVPSIAVAGTVLVLAALLATAVPVRRALRVDPAVTLRSE